MSDLPKFLRELFSSFWSSICVVLTVVSIITLVHPFNFASKRYRWIPLTAAMVSWSLASFVLYRRKERQIEALSAEVQNLKSKRPHLIIQPKVGSKYYIEVNRTERSKALGVYFLFPLTIENKGDVNSVISEFELSIKEMKSYPHLQPEFRSSIQTHDVNVCIPQFALLHQESMVVGARNVKWGTVPLYIRDVPPNTVQELHCRLAVTDTDGNQATEEFVVARAGR